MPKLFRDKYRIKSARLCGYDYTWPGAYFVTICTQNRKHYFGKIMNGEMRLNELGKIVNEEWIKTAKIRLNVNLDTWVVMPNHIHGIIIINDDILCLRKYIRCNLNTNVETPRRGVLGNMHSDLTIETPRRGVSTRTDSHSRNKWQPNSLGSIINQFKSICTKRIRKIDPDFVWQPRFYDRIIDSDREFYNTQQYILDNPIHWGQDKNCH